MSAPTSAPPFTAISAGTTTATAAPPTAGIAHLAPPLPPALTGVGERVRAALGFGAPTTTAASRTRVASPTGADGSARTAPPAPAPPMPGGAGFGPAASGGGWGGGWSGALALLFACSFGLAAGVCLRLRTAPAFHLPAAFVSLTERPG